MLILISIVIILTLLWVIWRAEDPKRRTAKKDATFRTIARDTNIKSIDTESRIRNSFSEGLLSNHSKNFVVYPPSSWRLASSHDWLQVDGNWRFLLESTDSSPFEIYIYSIKGWSGLLKVGVAANSNMRREIYYDKLLWQTALPKRTALLVEHLFMHSTYHRAHTSPPKWCVGNFQDDNAIPSIAGFYSEVGSRAPGATEVREITLEETTMTLQEILHQLRSAGLKSVMETFSIVEHRDHPGRSMTLVHDRDHWQDHEQTQQNMISGDDVSVDLSYTVGEYNYLADSRYTNFMFEPILAWSTPKWILLLHEVKYCRSEAIEVSTNRLGECWGRWIPYSGQKDCLEENIQAERYTRQYINALCQGRRVIESFESVEKCIPHVLNDVFPVIDDLVPQWVRWRNERTRFYEDTPILDLEAEAFDYLEGEKTLFLKALIEVIPGYPFLCAEEDLSIDAFRSQLPENLNRGLFISRLSSVDGVGPARASVLLAHGFSSLAGLHECTLSDLCAAKGIGKKTASAIKSVFT